MRYQLIVCDVPGCGEQHVAPWGEGHPGWTIMQGIGIHHEATGEPRSMEVCLCPADKARAAEAVLGAPRVPKEG